MKHYGDITKLNGHELPIVDIITGGSPCQDLSVAGKREGLSGKRSGLFMEQIRIVKEMRNECIRQLRSRGSTYLRSSVQPRFMVWENVPGAFSSNKGEDFRCVLEETAKIAEEDATIPKPLGGKWTPAGCIMGTGWSVAWRVHDAQFWGVPQRRKRISLVADFGGEFAPEILFERKSVSGDIEKSREEGQGTSTDTERSIDKTSKCLNAWDVQSKHIQPENGIAETLYAGECRYAGGESYVLQNKAISFQERAGKPGGGKGILIQNERTGALSTLNNQSVFCIQGNCIDRADTAGCNGKGWREDQCYTLNTVDRPAVCAFEPGSMSRVGGHYYEDGKSGTLRANAGDNQMAVCIENHPADSRVKVSEDGIVQTLSSRMGTGGGNVPMVMEQPYNATTGSFMRTGNSGIAETLMARDYKDPQIIYGQSSFSNYENQVSTLKASGGDLGGGSENLCINQSVVRRLTPLECERLQGYPDGWTDIGEWTDSRGKKHKDADSPRYKALGNSIALPFWQWMADKMVKVLKANDVKQPTMGSLFDGIGGFPLVYSRCGCKPVWASEIEEFPIAVTKKRFNGD